MPELEANLEHLKSETRKIKKVLNDFIKYIEHIESQIEKDEE